jgi:hypothetical protein
LDRRLGVPRAVLYAVVKIKIPSSPPGIEPWNPELIKNVQLLFETFIDMLPTKYKLKVKVKLSHCLTKHRAMKAYWGNGGIVPRIL